MSDFKSIVKKTWLESYSYSGSKKVLEHVPNWKDESCDADGGGSGLAF